MKVIKYPFNIQEVFDAGIIDETQAGKLTIMIRSKDQEMKDLAITIVWDLLFQTWEKEKNEKEKAKVGEMAT